MTINQYDVLRCSTICATPTETHITSNVYFAQYLDAGDLDDEDAADDWEAYMTAMWNAVKPGISNQYSVRRFTLYKIGSADVLPTRTLGLLGTGSSDFMPIITAQQVLARTGRRRTVGRKFLFGFGEGAYEKGVVSSGVIGAIQAYADLWIAPFGGGGGTSWQPGVWSYLRGTWHPFTTNSVSVQAIGLSRRRL